MIETKTDPHAAFFVALNPRANDVWRKGGITRWIEEIRGKYVWFHSEFKGVEQRRCEPLSVWRKWAIDAEFMGGKDA